MKRRLSLIVSVCVLLGFLAPCRAYAVDVSATAAILMDAVTGEVLYEKNADRQMRIASTTKIMTALVAIEHGGLKDTVEVGWAAMVEGGARHRKRGDRGKGGGLL